jgi:REP element-mobilizing transposase RayT
MRAFHAIFTAYGFWLPNDPRGSWSTWVGAWELFRYGGTATKVETTRSVAARRHDRALREETKHHLKYPPVIFTGVQARAIGQGFTVAVQKCGYQILACAILPDHVHVVIRAHRNRPTLVVGHLKREATLQLVAQGLHPFQHLYETGKSIHSCWAEKCWRVYLDTREDEDRAIRYVEGNPQKEGKPRQHWSCIATPTRTRRDKPAG